MAKRSQKRSPTELRPIMTRMPEKLRRRLEAAAKRQERSLNAEINYRLETSFAFEGAYGDDNHRRFDNEMFVGFEAAGAAAAGSRGIDGDWVDDAESYSAAMFGALEALILASPCPLDPETIEVQFKQMKVRIVGRELYRKFRRQERGNG